MAEQKKKGRKLGRQKKSGQNLRYIHENRHAQSHRRRIARHLRRFPDDQVARTALTEYEVKLGIFHRKAAS